MNRSNKTLQVDVGVFLRETRIAKNIPQRILAERSGVSVSAVKHLEAGTGATLATFIAVCRTLGKLNWLEGLAPHDEISPIAIMDRQAKVHPRQRARLSKRTEVS